jgi:G:T-mismatch repair DNA endonuclease (very short patch repair protein)
MHTCKVCNTQYKRILGHIIKTHKNLNVDLRNYLSFYYNFDICEEYKNGSSAKEISNKIVCITDDAIKPNKKDILRILKSTGVEIRKTSDAIKEWSKRKGGPWNKGLTKDDHESIKKYSETRTGKNNGYYTGSEESRRKTRYWEYLSEENLSAIRQKSGDTLKRLYRSGELKHKSKTDQEWAKASHEKRQDGFRKWIESDNSHFVGAESKLEKQIANVLEKDNIRYKKQLKLKKDVGYFFYDYFLIDYDIIVEYNGTYWHSDPRKYNKDFYNQSKKMFAHEIWKRDEDKKILAETNGYSILTLWEEDYKSLTSQEFMEKISEVIKDKINQKDKD